MQCIFPGSASCEIIHNITKVQRTGQFAVNCYERKCLEVFVHHLSPQFILKSWTGENDGSSL